MSPMPPMPPPPGIAGPDFFLGRSATIASVVISRAGDRSRVLQRHAHHLGRVDDAGVDEVDILLVLGVIAIGVRLLLQQLADDDRGFLARILDDDADRVLDRAAHDGDALGLVVIVAGEVGEGLGGIEQGGAAAGHDAFLDRRLGGVERVIDAVLALLHFDFGGAADADHRNAAGQLGQTFLQLFLVIVAGGLFDLGLDLGDAGLDVGLLAGAIDDGGVVLVDADLLGRAQHVDLDVLKLDADVLADHLAAGDDGDVFQHGLAAIAEARRLHGRDLEAAAQLVDHQGGQRFAFDFLGDDEERTARLHHGFQDRQHGLQAGELLLVDQDQRHLPARPSSFRHW